MVGVGNGRFDVLQSRLAAGEVVIAIFLPHLPLVHDWTVSDVSPLDVCGTHASQDFEAGLSFIYS
jgi:hypothetical protein